MVEEEANDAQPRWRVVVAAVVEEMKVARIHGGVTEEKSLKERSMIKIVGNPWMAVLMIKVQNNGGDSLALTKVAQCGHLVVSSLFTRLIKTFTAIKVKSSQE